jgi:hypothetical protein
MTLRPNQTFGWGWASPRGEPAIHSESIGVFGAFLLVVTGVFRWQGELRGMIGSIAEPRHPLLQQRFVFWSMCGADPDLNFTTDSRWDLFFSRQDLRPD